MVFYFVDCFYCVEANDEPFRKVINKIWRGTDIMQLFISD